MQPIITDVESIFVRSPFLPSIESWTRLNNHGWEYLEVVRVRTDSPHVVGFGETLVYYTGETVEDELAAFAVGRTPLEVLASPGVGVSLRMALYDVLGQSMGVPVNRLFARPVVRDRCPISWWNTKMPAGLLASQAADAVAAGYRSHKIKARPWFDIHEQVDAVAAVTPEDYRIDLDWNSMLVSAGRALPVLARLQQQEKIGLFESPIDRTDTAGQARLRAAISTPLVEHYDPHLVPGWLSADTLDGFVVSGPEPATVFGQADAAQAFHKEVFLQLCGTGITTAWVAHLGSVVPAARLPAVTAMNIYREDLLVDSLEIADGHVRVPDAPGLGIAVDEDLLERLRVPRGTAPPPLRRLLTFALGDGSARQYVSAAQLWDDSTVNATMPVQGSGASLSIREDDHSLEFDAMHRNAMQHPVWL
ncbi:enolase C-terminal domain-like protein [Plantibacter sp. YIM 135249]|uniref:enolase C-terminal domain-like protein n=1 Tax=Plantibacter sp. YIM 135249 TaxID=3423918 RepID=UPI003D34B5EC